MRKRRYGGGGRYLMPSRPVLRYHGGKWRLAQWVAGHFPAHRVYTEAYGGAASVLLQKPRAHAEVYNDLDEEIVNVFRVLQDKSAAALLIEKLGATPFARSEFKLSYQDTECPIERARRTIVRSFQGFSSASCTKTHRTGFRFSSKRSGTTPAADWANHAPSLWAVVDRFMGVVIECRPALEVIRIHDDYDALHYVDPPYLLSTRWREAKYDRCYRFEMSEQEHINLAKQLHSCRGAVVVSGYPSPLYDDLYRGWETVSISSRTGEGSQRKTKECLWLNPACSAALKSRLPFDFDPIEVPA